MELAQFMLTNYLLQLRVNKTLSAITGYVSVTTPNSYVSFQKLNNINENTTNQHHLHFPYHTYYVQCPGIATLARRLNIRLPSPAMTRVLTRNTYIKSMIL